VAEIAEQTRGNVERASMCWPQRLINPVSALISSPPSVRKVLIQMTLAKEQVNAGSHR
jgi:hypothetical protein